MMSLMNIAKYSIIEIIELTNFSKSINEVNNTLQCFFLSSFMIMDWFLGMTSSIQSIIPEKFKTGKPKALML